MNALRRGECRRAGIRHSSERSSAAGPRPAAKNGLVRERDASHSGVLLRPIVERCIWAVVAVRGSHRRPERRQAASSERRRSAGGDGDRAGGNCQGEGWARQDGSTPFHRLRSPCSVLRRRSPPSDRRPQWLSPAPLPRPTSLRSSLATSRHEQSPKIELGVRDGPSTTRTL